MEIKFVSRGDLVTPDPDFLRRTFSKELRLLQVGKVYEVREVDKVGKLVKLAPCLTLSFKERPSKLTTRQTVWSDVSAVNAYDSTTDDIG